MEVTASVSAGKDSLSRSTPPIMVTLYDSVTNVMSTVCRVWAVCRHSVSHVDPDSLSMAPSVSLGVAMGESSTQTALF